MIKWGLRIIKPIICTCIGLYVAHLFNVIEYFDFVPKSSKYDICLTIYIAIADVVIGMFSTFVMKYYTDNFQSTVIVTLMKPGDEAALHTFPVLKFNSNDLIEVDAKIDITGRAKNFEDTELIIKKPVIGDLQIESDEDPTHSLAIIDSEGNCCVKLKTLFGNDKKRTEVSITCRIVMIKSINQRIEVRLEPELAYKSLFTKFESNYGKIQGD